MQVETYEIETSSGDTYATEEERNELVRLAEDLALTGQVEIMATGSGDMFPYRKMTVAEQNVYGLFLTKKTKLDRFRDSVIPLRVLQVASHAVGLEDPRIGYLEVWHQPGEKDPLLVGKKSEYENREVYLLARWGDVLDSFPELQQRAVEITKAKVKAWTEAMIGLLQARLPGVEAKAISFVHGECDEWKPSMYELELAIK